MSQAKVGFLGTGWIGRHRMEAMVRSGLVEALAFVEPDDAAAAAAQEIAPEAQRLFEMNALFAVPGLDGVVIATPSAAHAGQSIAALGSGLAVFCQKPLAPDRTETAKVVEAARRADRLLSIDLSYRHTAALQAMKRVIGSGELGHIYVARCVFHNAYGPDKPWFYDRALSGGGCLIDLGTHLIDLMIWLLDRPPTAACRAKFWAGGERLSAPLDRVEDHAVVDLEFAQGTAARIECSWNLHLGRDAEIAVDLFGTNGSVGMRNLAGSFYDFAAWKWQGTSQEPLSAPPDEWGGRAAVAWAERLNHDKRFDPSCREYLRVAEVIEAAYNGGL